MHIFSTDQTSAPDVSPVLLDLSDAGELLTLQRAAYVSEARLNREIDLPPLTQTLSELRAEMTQEHVATWGVRLPSGHGERLVLCALASRQALLTRR